MAHGRLAWLVFVLSPCLGVAATPAGAAPASGRTRSLAERIDLTRITKLHADYARAVRDRNEADLANFEDETIALLRDDVLPHAPDAGRSPEPGASAGAGRGAGDATGSTEAADAPSRLTPKDTRVVHLAQEFISLAGRHDRESLARKEQILKSLQAASEEAHFPSRSRGAQRTGVASPAR